MVSLQQNALISPEMLSREFDGETVLLDLTSESCFDLDEVGNGYEAKCIQHGSRADFCYGL
jgi:hypothetical protein